MVSHCGPVPVIDFLASIEPASIPLLAVLAFALSLYPLGLMLGAPCSPCCGQPCSACEEGQLPNTVTVTLDGFADTQQGPDLLSLEFAADFGSGATGIITAPGGDPDIDAGSVTSVKLTNGGSGYATFGRGEPSLTISGGSGSGATFTPTLQQQGEANPCDFPTWSIDSVSISGAGTGYTYGEPLTVDIDEGDTEGSPASIFLKTTLEEPTLTVDGNATTTISYSKVGEKWAIDSVAVSDGGSGYEDLEQLQVFLGEGDVEDAAASLLALVERVTPDVGATFIEPSGSGADLSVTLTQAADPNGRDIWQVTGFNIDDPGSGYVVGDSIAGIVLDGEEAIAFSAEVGAVDENGGITSVTLNDIGEYYKSTGVLESVSVNAGGLYFKDTGVPASVGIDAPGVYYREDAEQEPCVAEVTVTISQDSPSDGYGAIITATVDDDTASETFGQIIDLTIVEAGDDYLGWRLVATQCCGHYLNGKSFVLRRQKTSSSDTERCTYTHVICGGWGSVNVDPPLPLDGNHPFSSLSMSVTYPGPDSPPVFLITGGSAGSCAIEAVAEEAITNCDEFGFSASSGDVTVEVVAGGEYDERDGNNAAVYDEYACDRCCQGSEPPPEEITVSLSDLTPIATPGAIDGSGDYVLQLAGPSTGVFGGVGLFGGAGGLSWEYEDTLVDPQGGIVRITVLLTQGNCGQRSTSPYVPTCDNCVKKCGLRIQVSVRSVGGAALGAALGYGYVEGGGGFGGECTGCTLDTPVCAPIGSYELRFLPTFDEPVQYEISFDS